MQVPYGLLDPSTSSMKNDELNSQVFRVRLGSVQARIDNMINELYEELYGSDGHGRYGPDKFTIEYPLMWDCISEYKPCNDEGPEGMHPEPHMKKQRVDGREHSSNSDN